MSLFDDQKEQHKADVNWSALNEIPRDEQRKKQSWQLINQKMTTGNRRWHLWKKILHPGVIGPAVVFCFLVLFFPGIFQDGLFNEKTSEKMEPSYGSDGNGQAPAVQPDNQDEPESGGGLEETPDQAVVDAESLDIKLQQLMELYIVASEDKELLPEFFEEFIAFPWEAAYDRYSEEAAEMLTWIAELDEMTRKEYMAKIVEDLYENHSFRSNEASFLLYHLYTLQPVEFLNDLAMLVDEQDQAALFQSVVEYAEQLGTLDFVKELLIEVRNQNDITRDSSLRAEWNNGMAFTTYQMYNDTVLEETLLEKSGKILTTLEKGNYDLLAEEVHEEKGLTISFTADFEEWHQFSKEEVSNFVTDSSRYYWGEAEGQSVVVSPAQLIRNYFLNTDFTISAFNSQTSERGERLNTIYENYIDGLYVEYFAADAASEKNDWRKLRLVFEENNGAWQLVAIVQDTKQ
ncbi:hypothetical protein SAMN05421736_12425 [Evansella caseinilytica]|uniref:Uncharacterized protein n=1 Tax=Evansella caseinilytica TaxID=1503961 RepID=A0A1H3UPY8_9BACI|nr:hypothetical protein [Evansella caseinilytica]SDZ64276.1 hypothetical protein SAMN05421736_12425 [Evansella caseinilytica]